MVSVDNWLQRDDAPRARDPARALGARAAALRRADLVVGGAQRGQVLAARSSSRSPDARTSGRSCSTLAAILQRRGARRDRRARARRALLRRARRAASRSCRARAIAGRDPGGDRRAHSEGAARERLLDFAIRTGPWGDAYGANPGGLTLAALEAAAERHRHGARSTPRLDEVLHDAVGQGRAGAAVHHARTCARLARAARAPRRRRSCWSRRRHLRSNNSWMHNVPSLVTGTRPLHAADPSRRRRARRPAPTARRARVRSKAGQHRRAGRGERRDDARRRVPAARLGPRQAGRALSRRRRATPASATTCSRPASWSTCRRATRS